MALIISVIVVLGLLLINEAWWHKHKLKSELGRKFIHITVGSFVATWPFYLSWDSIRLISLAFILVVGLSQYFHLFRAIHSVQRPTFGEYFFALSVGILTYVTHNKWVYAAAILQMSLADGLAAVIGVKYGVSNRYKVFGSSKSLVGSLTFLITSIVILLSLNYFSDTSYKIELLIQISVLATILENISIRGSDNFLVPVAVAALLSISIH
ncbi:MAG: SEC59/DGK1/VTE5 family protein [Candidatus Saccharimonadales bacterium]